MVGAEQGKAVNARSLQVVARGLDRPESVTLGPDGLLYAGGWNGEIYRVDPESGAVREIANIGGTVLGLCCDADGNIFACNVRAGTVHRVARDGSTSVWSSSASGEKYTVPNYCAFAADGSLWLSDSGREDPDRASGRIVRIPPGGGEGTTESREPLNFPNGLCMDERDDVLFLESFGYGVSRLRQGRVDRIARLDGVTPDGIAVDVDGGIVVACFYPYRILYIAPGSSTAEVLVEDTLGITMKMPANVAFFGPSLDQVAISGLGGDSILGADAPRPGLPLKYPVLAP